MAAADGARSSGNLASGNVTRRIIARILFVAVIVIDLVLGAYVVRLYYLHPRTDDAYVRANIVGVAPEVSGTIVELPLRDNQHVKAGDLLFVIDPRPYQAELDLAEARLALTNLQIEALDRAIGAAKARQKQAEADAGYQRQYLARLAPLEKEAFVTANKVADVRSKLLAARAATEQTRNEVGQAEKQLGQAGDINARRAEAEAKVYKAKLNVDYCRVRAQFDGYVTNLNTTVGQYANVGTRGDEPGRQSHLVCDRQFPRDLPCAHRARNERAGLSARLSEPALSRRGRGRRLGAVPEQRRHRRGSCQRRADAQLGAPRPALSGADHAQRRRSQVSVPDGRDSGRHDRRRAAAKPAFNPIASAMNAIAPTFHGRACGGIAPVA